MKSFLLKNKNGEILQSKAFEIEDGIFIIGKLDNNEINCNTFPMSKDLINKIYGLEMI